MAKRIISVFAALAIFCTCMAGMVAFAADSAESGMAEKRVPTDFMVIPRDKRLVVSWQNPQTDDIKSIYLYDITDENVPKAVVSIVDGEYAEGMNLGYTINAVNASRENGSSGATILKNPLKTESDAGNYLIITAATNGVKYKFRLEIAYNNGETYSGEALPLIATGDYGKTSFGKVKGPTRITGWEEGVGGSPIYGFTLTDKATHSGNAALHVSANGIAQRINDTYQFLYPTFSEELKDGTKYRMSFYAKGEHRPTFTFQYYSDSDKGVNDRLWAQNIISEADKWTLCTHDFDYKKNGENHTEVRFRFYTTDNSLDIDDIEMREVGSDGTLGENLVVNGGFENEAGTTTVDAENAKAVSRNGKTTLTWDGIDTTKASTIMVYRKSKGKSYYDMVKALANTENSTIFDDEDAEEYRITTINSCGLESKGVIVVPQLVNIAPENVVTASRNAVISVSWKNPAADDIASVSLYDISGETEKLVIGSGSAATAGYTVDVVAPNGLATLTTDAGARNCINLRGLTNGSKYKYRLDIAYGNGEQYTGEIIPRAPFDTGKDAPVIAGADGDIKITDWAASVSGYPHFQFSLVRGGYDNSDIALRIAGNIDGAVSNTYQRLIPLLKEGESIERNKTYEFSYYVKGTGSYNIGIKRYTAADADNVTVENYKSPDTVNSNEWVKKSFEYGANASASPCELQIQPYFMIDRAIDEIYIDNVELREIGLDGTRGENLLANGGFETQADLQTVDVSNASTQEWLGKTVIKWDVVDQIKAETIVVYKKYKDTYWNPIKVADKTETFVTVASDDAKEYLIKTVNACGLASEGVIVPVTLPNVEYGDITLEKDANSGEWTAKVKIKNNTSAEFAPVFMIALYADGGALGEVNVRGDTAVAAGETKDLSVVLTEDTAKTYQSVKAFLWQDFASMIPFAVAEQNL